MQKTHQDRRALLDRLEKKYIKKVQLHAFKRESEQLKHELKAMRGTSIRQLKNRDFDFFDISDFRATYS